MSSRPSPDQFAAVMIEQNPLIFEVIGDLPNEFRLELIETPGDLIGHLLPAYNGHD